ncbi:hypothetical protein ONZ45_g885 [Pleurotus djamor]|nr:hypothetical protein ONZ45_g885 [Pleurotus djamor]
MAFKRLPTLPDDPSHPAQVALRTYSLSLSLSLGPSLLPFVLARILPDPKRAHKFNLKALFKVLRRELGYDGFAAAMTLAVAGGEVLRRYLNSSSLQAQESDDSVLANTSSRGKPPSTAFKTLSKLFRDFTKMQKTFVAAFLSSTAAMMLIQSGRSRALRLRNDPHSVDSIPFTPSFPRSSTSASLSSPTLDLTLLVFVRAIDALIQALVFNQSPKVQAPQQQNHDSQIHPDEVKARLLKEQDLRLRRHHRVLTARIDAIVFWACSARLPRSYVKWIGSLANLDDRLLQALRSLRSGSWSYIYGSVNEAHLLTSMSDDLGYPPSWGDPRILPARGGKFANTIWPGVGVNNRPGVGGLPCEVVHGGVPSRFGLDASCTANASIRGFHAFMKALTIYIPVHILPILISRPRSLLSLQTLISTLLRALRSASFLSSFVASYWFAVCSTRTLGLAKLFPFVSHDFWDGPYGCILAGCLTCGSSIWIENGRRRGEMALYVLPRAIRTSLPPSWVANSRLSRFIERLVFAISFASLITAATHKPNSLRGLSRWTVAFVLKGPNAGFWRRKRQGQATSSQTPSIPATPNPPDMMDRTLGSTDPQ